MDANKAPEGAKKIVLEFWTQAHYSKSELNTLLGEFVTFAAEGDDDIVEGSYEISYLTQEEILSAKPKLSIDEENEIIVKALENAEIDTVIRFGGDNDFSFDMSEKREVK